MELLGHAQAAAATKRLGLRRLELIFEAIVIFLSSNRSMTVATGF
jgi:hypothetical protein